MRTTTAILDFETNGFFGSSVLSISLRKDNGETLSRYYYPMEDYNERAISVNGLSEAVITAKRAGATYPLYFYQDSEIYSFFEDVKILVAHNIEFDYSFLPLSVKEMDMQIFCTMKSQTHKFYKNMSLKDTAIYFGIEFNEELAHGSDYDTLICQEIYNKIEEKIFTKDYLTKVFAGRDEDGEMIFPFGSLAGKTAQDLTEEERTNFLSKYTANTHEMYSLVASL
jgi:DNA polymerase III epsilon subunit-like protein